MAAQILLFSGPWAWAPLAVAASVLLVLGLLVIYFAQIYLRALFSGAKVVHPVSLYLSYFDRVSGRVV